MDEKQQIIKPTVQEQPSTEPVPNQPPTEPLPEPVVPQPVQVEPPQQPEPSVPSPQQVQDPTQVPPSQGQPISADNIPLIQDQVYFSWSEKEFIEHEKDVTWYSVIMIVLLLVAVGLYFLLHSIFIVVIVILMAVAFVITAAKKPKVVNFELNNHGVTIGNRATHYDEFKSFSIVDEPSIGAIVLNPFKRFDFPVSLYYDLSLEDRIVGILNENLPIEDANKDFIESLMRKIRF